MKKTMEHERLALHREHKANWKNWGPYLSERAWGTVREDYSDHLVKADISKEDEVNRMVQEVVEKLGGLDILINNAGIQIPGDSHEISIDSFDRVLVVNLRGAFVAARAAIRHFLEKEKPGVIKSFPIRG